MGPLADRAFNQVLHFAGKGIGAIYDTLFSSSDRKKSRELTTSLSEDIARNWAYLLSHRNGSLQPEVRANTSFDDAMCVVSFPELLVRVTRGRRELRVQLASPGLHGSWEDLADVLRKSSSLTAVPLPDNGLVPFANALETNWNLVIAQVAGA